MLFHILKVVCDMKTFNYFKNLSFCYFFLLVAILSLMHCILRDDNGCNLRLKQKESRLKSSAGHGSKFLIAINQLIVKITIFFIETNTLVEFVGLHVAMCSVTHCSFVFSCVLFFLDAYWFLFFC